MALMPRIDIDGQLYLFTRTVGQFASEVCISAHGGYLSSEPDFQIPGGVTLNFYSPEGVVTSDSDLTLITGREPAAIKDRKTVGDTCKNYLLSKFQGASHSGGSTQTYKSLENAVQSQMKRVAEHNDMRAHATSEEKLKSSQARTFDIATIRHRNTDMTKFDKTVLLADVIHRLNRYHPFGGYKVFHCAFCREGLG